MRKHLTVSLSACLVTASFVGCGEKSQDVQVSEQLDTLLDKMSRLQYADAPVEGNELAYTQGKEVEGVKVPGSTRFEAAYLDQALTLIPLAEEIKTDGTALQKQSANAIIGSIRTDEASFLIDEAERAFQSNANDVVSLRGKVGVLRDIMALNNSVAGDRAEIIETYRNGLSKGNANIVGIAGLQEQASAAGAEASQASKDLADYNAQIAELRDKVAEYEALELSLASKARTAQSTDKYDKLDQATAAAKEAEQAQADAEKFEIDAWISERTAALSEFKRQQLAGDAEASTGSLIAKLDSFLAEASEQTNIPSDSDIYSGLSRILDEAKSASSDDVLKAAQFLLGMSEYGTAAAADADERRRLVAAVGQRVDAYLGIIGVLEMKIAQIKFERQQMADKLAELEGDRKAVLAELSTAFDKYDAMIQAAAFDRMAAAIESLTKAETAVKGSGNDHDMELMSVYMLHARVLQQQNLSARSYQTTLASIASAGPELLGGTLHETISIRSQEMMDLIAQVSDATGELQSAAGVASSNLLTGLNAESTRGQIASRQLEVYDSLIQSLSQSGFPSDASEDGTP